MILQNTFSVKILGSKFVVRARAGGASTTSLLPAALFAKRKTKFGGGESEGGAGIPFPPTPFPSRPARAVRSFVQNKSELFDKGSSKQEIAVFQPTKSTVLSVGLRLFARRYESPFDRSSKLSFCSTANFLLFAIAKILNFHFAAGGARKRQFFCPVGAVAQKR